MEKRLKKLTFLSIAILLPWVASADSYVYNIAQAGVPRLSQDEIRQQQVYQQQLIQYQRDLEEYHRNLAEYNRAIQAQKNGQYLQQPPTIYYGNNLDNDSVYVPYKSVNGQVYNQTDADNKAFQDESIYYNY